MQAPLAVVGLLPGLAAWWPTGHIGWLLGALIMIANWPLMYLAIMPANYWLMATDPAAAGPEGRTMIQRSGPLHPMRTVVGLAACIAFLLASLV